MQGLQKISIARPRLADFVYDQIVAGLQSGAIGPNDSMHQVNLAEMLSVSRTPVREALLRLEQEGVLVSAPNGGFAIRRISRVEVRQIYQARQAVEGFCAGLLARDASPEVIANLGDVIQAQERKEAKTNAEYYDANRTIHRAFVQATNNAFLLENFDTTWNLSIAVQIFETLDQPKLEASLTGHSELCDAITSGNFEDAQRAMHEHIADGRDLQLMAL